MTAFIITFGILGALLLLGNKQPKCHKCNKRMSLMWSEEDGNHYKCEICEEEFDI